MQYNNYQFSPLDITNATYQAPSIQKVTASLFFHDHQSSAKKIQSAFKLKKKYKIYYSLFLILRKITTVSNSFPLQPTGIKRQCLSWFILRHGMTRSLHQHHYQKYNAFKHSSLIISGSLIL